MCTASATAPDESDQKGAEPMTRTALQPEGLAAPGPPYSPVVVSSDLVFTSGQVPFDEQGKLVSEDFREQAHQTFRNLERCLAAAGCGFADVVKVNAFLADLSDFNVYNEVYREYFPQPYPARTTVGAGLIGFRIEVEAIARKPA
jgi:2-iminobutanoate/2-iminopropanoate deaminase